MDIERIFAEVKMDLAMILSEINMDNLKDKHKEINHYLTFLEQASLLRNNTTVNESSVSNEIAEDERENTLSDEPVEIPQPIQEDSYVFVKRLKGGWLDNTDIFVPETIVRSIGLENGDVVKPTPKEPGKYYFQLIQKNPSPNIKDNIEVISFGKVKEKDGILVVSDTISGPIRFDEVPFEFLLRNDDILDFKLKAGDIVDIAYYKENISKTARVIWKYDSSNITTVSPKPSSFYKEKKEKEGGQLEPLLKDKTILIVGCEFKKDDYRQVFEEYEGNLEWIDGNEDTQRIEAKVKKADCIILITTFQRHRASNLIVSLAKQWDIPFKDVKVTGNKTILDSAFQLLNISETRGESIEY